MPTAARPGAGVRHGGDGAQRLGQHRRRAAVQQAVRLGVPGHGHGADGALGRGLGHHDAHALDEGARVGGWSVIVVSDMADRLAPVSDALPAVPPATPGTPARLLLIDGHSMAYRAFFALPVDKFATSSGEPTNAVFGFFSMIANLLRDEAPTHVAVAFDAGRTTFRTEVYESYKGNRDATPAPFKGQVDVIQRVLETMHIPYLSKPQFEADDILATLSVQARAQGMQVLICTGDRDALQLVNDDVTVLYPVKGVSELARMTPAAVETKYGVPPGALPRPGGARRRDQRQPAGHPRASARRPPPSGSCSTTVSRGSSRTRTRCPARRGSRCATTSSRCALNRQLNALLTDLELPLGPEDLAARPWDRTALHAILEELEFRAIRDRLFAMLPDEGGERPRHRRRGPAGPHACSARASSRRGSPARAGRPLGARRPRVRCSGAAATRGVSRWRTRTGRPRRSTSPRSSPPTRPRWPRGSRTRPRRRSCTPRRRPGTRSTGRGLPIAGVVLRHGARGVPVPARPPRVRPDRPRDRLPAPRARRRRGGRRRPGRARPRARRHRRGPPRGRPRRRRARPGRRARRRARRPRRDRAAGRTSSCRWSTCWRRMERTGIAIDHGYLVGPGEVVRRARCRTRPPRRTRSSGAR